MGDVVLGKLCVSSIALPVLLVFGARDWKMRNAVLCTGTQCMDMGAYCMCFYALASVELSAIEGIGGVAC